MQIDTRRLGLVDVCLLESLAAQAKRPWEELLENIEPHLSELSATYQRM